MLSQWVPTSLADTVVDWESIFDPQSNAPRFIGETATTASPVTTDADQDCIAANFASVTLADGDSISLTGTVTFDVALVGAQFRVGLFNGGVVSQDTGNPYVGLYSEAPVTTATDLKYGPGTHPSHPFGTGTSISAGILPGGGGVAANTPISFSLTITRDGVNLDVSTSYTDGGTYTRSGSVEDLNIISTAPGFDYTFNTASFLMGASMDGGQASFANIEVMTTSAIDSDGDGLPDSWEDANGLDRDDPTDAAVDSDSDSLTNLQEYQRGTDPQDDDSDDDTLLDGVETNTDTFVDADDTGTDPNNPDSDADGRPDGEEVANNTDPNIPNEAIPESSTRLFGIDFNRDDAFGSPSQSLFRVISGSTVQGDNSSSYTKTIGSYGVTISQPEGSALEFRGANTDNSRAIPGGDTSRSFLVADFIGTREGALDIAITNLPAGRYLFRSFHLDTSTGSTLAFAQGVSSSEPNTIEARLGGVLQTSVQPTALGAAGLGTTFIDDTQIPALVLQFDHDGTSALAIELRSTDENAGDKHLFVNGFELFSLPAE